ncbi:MAG TPA: hypothetical protein VIL48_12615 [Acidimicrobiales bacterium]
MSPVARSQAHAARVLAVSAVAIALALTTAFGVAVLANRGSVEVRLGDDTFAGQDAEDAARQIAESGPILYPDAGTGDRDIILQHLGDDPETGWLAFAARPAGSPRECTLQWQEDDEVFLLLDPEGERRGACDGREVPADGEGLTQYPVRVRDGELDVDINAADRTSTTEG